MQNIGLPFSRACLKGILSRQLRSLFTTAGTHAREIATSVSVAPSPKASNGQTAKQHGKHA